MAVSNKLKTFLDERAVRYVSIAHSQAFTAQQVAASVHIQGKKIAKTVIVKAGEEWMMAVLPASHRIDAEALTEALEASDVRLADEKEFARIFQGCEVGAMPPFGNLYGMKVVCDTALTADDEIYFNAGTHTEVIGLAFRDFRRLVEPRIATFAKHM